MGKMRRSMLPPDQAAVMDQKPGEISPLITDQNGYFIYKLKSEETIPLEQAKDEIRGTLRSQRFQDSMKAIQDSATPTLDDQYFGAGPVMPQRPGQPPLPTPRSQSKPD
jgi:parvulin-like peptidyl-prolyl isomerase